MTLLRGLLDNGVVVPGTEWVVRDSEAWYDAGDDDIYLRERPPEILVGHWTAGPRRTGYAAAQKTYRAMQARRKDNGAEMSVSAQFVLSDDGIVTQLADLKWCCVHADRLFNLRGLSLEYAFPGTVAQAAKLGEVGGPAERRRVAEAYVQCVTPSEAALKAYVRWADMLASRFDIPKIAYTRTSRFDMREMRTAKGACEHFHAASTTKVDAAGFLTGALVAAGWKAA